MTLLPQQLHHKRSASLPTKMTRQRCVNNHPNHMCHVYPQHMLGHHNNANDINQELIDESQRKQKGFKTADNNLAEQYPRRINRLADPNNPMENTNPISYNLIQEDQNTHALSNTDNEKLTVKTPYQVESDNNTKTNKIVKIEPILKSMMLQFSNVTRRKQPMDLLAWSARYFSAVSRDKRIHPESQTGSKTRINSLSSTIIATLHNRLGHEISVSVKQLEENWKYFNLDPDILYNLINYTRTVDRVTWLKFLSAMSSTVAANIDRSMLLCLTIMATRGTASKIHLSDFHSIYVYHGELFEGQSCRTLVRMMAWLEAKIDIATGYISIEDLTL